MLGNQDKGNRKQKEMSNKIGVSPGLMIGLYIVGSLTGVAIVYFGVIKPVFEAVGLKDSKEDKENKATIEQGSKKEYWSPSFWKQAPYKLTYAEPNYAKFAGDISSAVLGLGTDEEKIYGTFRKLRSQQDLSKIADVYFIKYNQDLYETLVDEFDLDELATLQKIIDNFIK